MKTVPFSSGSLGEMKLKKYLVISVICALGVVSPNSYAMNAQFRESHNNISEQKKAIVSNSSVVKRAEKSNPLIKGLRKVGSFVKKHRVACSMSAVVALAAIMRGTGVDKVILDSAKTKMGDLSERAKNKFLLTVGERYPNFWEECTKDYVADVCKSAGVAGQKDLVYTDKLGWVSCSNDSFKVWKDINELFPKEGLTKFVGNSLTEIGEKSSDLWKKLTKNYIENVCKGDPCGGGIKSPGYFIGKDCVVGSSLSYHNVLGAVTCGSEMNFEQHKNLIKDLVERTCAFFQEKNGVSESYYNYILGMVKCSKIDSDRAKDIVKNMTKEACSSYVESIGGRNVSSIDYLGGASTVVCP